MAITPTATLIGLNDPSALAFDSSGNLYVANSNNGTVSKFAPGSTTPTATLTGLSNPKALAFDSSGNLYVANSNNDTVSEFAPGSTTPTATLTGLSDPQALAFDGSGNLYVANYDGGTVSEFAPGSTTPTATLTGLIDPQALAFDGSGNLYVANYDGGTVSEFAPGSTTPTATLAGLSGPWALAFDSSGNLYVANEGNSTVSEFAPGSTMPTATLTGLSGPIGLAFDGSGNLYVANPGSNTVSEFAPGSTTPTATLSGLDNPSALAFDPRDNLYVANEGNGTVSEFANTTAQTIGLYNPATSVFYLRNTNDSGYADTRFEYGPANAGWIPIAGDWDGNGTVTIGLYNPQTSVFYLHNTNTGGYADTHFQYGPAGLPVGSQWIPIAGDWDGNGTDTIGLYNPVTSTFYLRNTNDSGYADVTFAYGPAGAGWIPIAGDWDGNGTDTLGLYNPATSTFYLRNTTSLQGPNDKGYADVAFAYGPAGAGWIPIAGDWDGNGTDTLGLYNPATSTFYLRNTTSLQGPNDKGYADVTFAYGAANAGWLPIAGDWNGPGNALMAAGGSVTASANVLALTQTDLQPIISEAIARWTGAGLDAAAVAKLTQAQFVISNLPGSYLGKTEGNLIYIDANAAGYGWFVDPTPALDEEFTPSPNNQQLRAIDPRAVDRIDLLTVVEHELGHVLGLKDLNISTDDLMSGVLGIGVRRDPSHQDVVDAALAS